MYVPDIQTTDRYRTAIVEMGFSQAHADLVQVDVARAGDARRAQQPLYRVTTGSDVLRRGAIIRRVLMLWYVYDETDVFEETRDRNALADMIVATIAFLPKASAEVLPPLPEWADARAVAVTSGAEGRLRRAA